MSAGSSTLSAHASDLSSDLRDGIYKTGIDSSITYSSPGTGFRSLGAAAGAAWAATCMDQYSASTHDLIVRQDYENNELFPSFLTE